MDERRRKRLEHLIRNEVEEVIRREVSDPRIGIFSITSVKVTPDVKHAAITVSFLGPQEEQEKALEGIRSARGFIRHKLSRRLPLRFMPDISFELDEHAEYRIEAILAELHREHDEGHQGETR